MYTKINDFIKKEATKELKALNIKIDKKIKAGKNYSKEALTHKSLLALTR